MKEKRIICLFLCCWLLLPGLLLAQGSRTVTLDLRNVPVRTFFDEIRKQTGLGFVYNTDQTNEMGLVSVTAKNKPVDEVLKEVFANTDFTYRLEDKIVTITKQTPKPGARTLIGIVVDDEGLPLPGVAVFVKGTSAHAITDIDGRYSLPLPEKACEVTYSYVGMKQETLQIKAGKNNEKRTVTLHSDTEIEEVVVTGIVTKNKNSFTGSATTVTGEELRQIGLQNPIASLSALDPAFNVLENDLFGSDPNHLPDINIRGKSSVIGLRDEAVNDPNQPLFIVDGFESSLETVYNLDLNRIESMTILKDAASTAIYGSKAANGVVVVETVKPKAGKLRLNYNGSVAISKPDLSSYNLMNSSEKLEFEQLAGRYTVSSGNWSVDNEILYSEIYNKRKAEIASGVDTYWLSEPLRTGVNQKHQLYAEGGQGGFLFGIGVGYNGIDGVMKKSDRDSYSGNLDLIYRVNKLQFTNKFTATYTDTSDPIVAFSTYASANPYYKKVDENGEITPWLQNDNFATAANPSYNASLNSRNEKSTLLLSNYFIAEYTPIETLKLRARFGLTHSDADGENFISPLDTRYTETTDATRRGSFTSSNTKSTQYDGELTATYAEVIGKHRFTFALDGKLSEYRQLSQGYRVIGFPEGDYTYPSFANGYPEGSTASYSESVSRNVSFLGTLNYAYDNRYLLDVNYTTNGSSVFGSTKRFKNTWSVGLGWNIMNEEFFKENIHGVSMLKLRASVGNPGNTSFDSAMSLTTYRFLYNSFNYFGHSTILNVLGNRNLKWQTTLDKNFGFDLTMLNDRLTIDFNYYDKRTDPLLISVYTVPSSGVSSWYTNLGLQRSKGVLATVSYYILRSLKDRLTWSVRGTLRHETSELDDIDGHMDDLNNYGKSRNTKRYYNGADPDDIWAVRSAGIDPSNGRELFIKKDGTYTYDFSYDDEVVVGNSRSKIEGNLSSSFSYKGFSAGLTFGYKWGGKAFNSALYDKVENISGAQLNYNQDKRALYDRWQQPGDRAQFKNIASSVNTPISSRFVQKNNSLTLQTITVGYDFYEFARQIGVESLRLSAYMNDVFWLTSIKKERGTDYPFARSFTFALSFTL